MISPQSASQVLTYMYMQVVCCQVYSCVYTDKVSNLISFITRQLSLLPLLHCGNCFLCGSVRKKSQEEIPQNFTRSSICTNFASDMKTTRLIPTSETDHVKVFALSVFGANKPVVVSVTVGGVNLSYMKLE